MHTGAMFKLTDKENRILRSLSTPQKIQDYLEKMPANFEKSGETLHSPRVALREKKAHCIEGALIAALALWMHGEDPLLMDLKTLPIDEYHVVAPFKQNGYWGAISKTNHSILRYRDPIYKTLRELALSYFHEYFKDDGKKTLVSFSSPLNMKKFGTEWITSEEDLWWLDAAIEAQKHIPLVPSENKKLLRPASRIEIEATKSTQWKRNDRRT
jgi:hypothetical protein